MTEFAEEAEHQRIEYRSTPLLPEEEHAGSDDPESQARVILEDSDARTADPERGAEESTQVADR